MKRAGKNRKPLLNLFAVLILAGPIASAGTARAAPIPLIDAHSQVDHLVDLGRVIPLMDRAGVRRTILSARDRLAPEQLIAFASRHPGRIVPAVRSKSGAYEANRRGFYRFLRHQLMMSGFRGMAEVLMWHAQKGGKAPQMVVPPDAPQVQAILRAVLKRGWPFVAHIEFAGAGRETAGDRDTFMVKFEAMLAGHPGHPFALIHMGQLHAAEVRRLLGAHKNLHFLTSHSNPVTVGSSNQPWVNLFEGERIAPEWRALILQYPDRFILAFDNVFAEHWGQYFLDQAALWQKALAGLPAGTAHALAHRNAERLWGLDPLR